MRFKEIVNEGFWDTVKNVGSNLQTARAARRAGNPMTFADVGLEKWTPQYYVDKLNDKLKNRINPNWKQQQQQRNEDAAINEIAKKAAQRWSLHLTQLEQANGNQPLQDADFQDMLAVFLTRIIGVRYSRADIASAVGASRDDVKIQKFISDELKKKRDIQKQQAQQQAQQNRANAIQRSQNTDPETGIEYGTSVKLEVKFVPRHGPAYVEEAIFTFTKPYRPGIKAFWLELNGRVAARPTDQDKKLYNDLTAKARRGETLSIARV